MALKLVIFDVDGLMLDTERLNYQLYQEACREQNLAPDFAIFKQTIGCPDENEAEVYGEAYPGADIGQLQVCMRQKEAAHLESGGALVKPGLFALLDAIDQKGGIQKAVGTSRTRDVAKRALSVAGIWDRMNGGAYADMVEHGKPAPDIFLKCCELFGVAPGDALVLEDSENGILAALRANIPVIAVPDLVEPRAELLAQCYTRCDSLLDVIGYMN